MNTHKLYKKKTNKLWKTKLEKAEELFKKINNEYNKR